MKNIGVKKLQKFYASCIGFMDYLKLLLLKNNFSDFALMGVR